MDNPEKPTMVSTQDEGKQKTQHRKLKKNQHGSQHKPEGNSGACEGQAAPSSLKTSTTLDIYLICVGHHYAQKQIT